MLLYGETTTSCQFDLLWAFDVPDLLEELATRRNPKAIQYAYIGLYQKVGVKEFEWSDSSPVNFSKWRPDEPQEQPNHEKLCGTVSEH